MRCFIRVVDGAPFEHPITEDNFRMSFPEVDLENLPSWVCEFVRQEPPVLGPYDKAVAAHSYKLIDGKYTDVYEVTRMTPEERAVQIAEVMQNKPFLSWVFDEASCSWVPPVAYPTDGKRYVWSDSGGTWVEYKIDAQGSEPNVIG